MHPLPARQLNRVVGLACARPIGPIALCLPRPPCRPSSCRHQHHHTAAAAIPAAAAGRLCTRQQQRPGLCFTPHPGATRRSSSGLQRTLATTGRRSLTGVEPAVPSSPPPPGSNSAAAGGQQQQQDAGAAQSRGSSSSTSTMGPAGADGGSGSDAITAAMQALLSEVPSLSSHPGAIPLQLQDGNVVDAAGNIILQQLSSHMTLNPEASSSSSGGGALVFGAASERGPAHFWDITVGSLKFRRFLACARNKLWWMTPEWGASLHTLPPETQFLLLELEPEQQQQAGSSSGSGRYALVLPLIDGAFRATCRPNRSWSDRAGSLVLRVESGDEDTKGQSCDSVLLVAASSDPFALVDAGVAVAAAMSGGAAPRAEKQLPASLDGFGWCTWDAFYSTVSARGLVEGLSSLQAGGVTPRLLIIDDGWQLTDVDPPYAKAPTTQLADVVLPEGGRAGEVFEGTREMLLETQDTYYEQSAKLLAEASGTMQQEVRNLFPTVANTGAIGHHHHTHPPGTASWDAPQQQQQQQSQAKSKGGAAAAPGQLSVMDGSGALAPDWAQQRGDAAASAAAGSRRRLRSRTNGNAGDEAAAPLLGGPEQQQQQAAVDGAASVFAAFGKYGIDLPSLAEKYGVELDELKAALQDGPLSASGPKAAAAAAESKLRAAVAEAEERLREAVAEAEDVMLDALVKAAPSPRQQFVLITWAQKAAGALAGLGTAAFLLFYQWVIEPAAPNSLRVRAFAALTNSLLRGAMLMFFASASDFTRRLTSVEANGKFARLDAGPEEDWEGAPADLRSVVTAIKQQFGVRHVYCWHGLPAYWGGVMPDSPALAQSLSGGRLVYPRPTESIAEVEPSLLWSPAVLAGVGIADDPAKLYHSMHAYLAASAVDGVKVDCQAGAGLVGSRLGGGALAAGRFQAALEASIARHFPGNHAINCMCHSSENFYRFARTAVARVSDDYYPRDPASSTPHIGACAFNSLYLGALVQPDWDMFQSAHPAGVLHGMARAVSGGAVYVSDKPGQHNFELLGRLVLPGGGVLRAALPGRPTRDCLFADVLRDGKTMLKVWNVNAHVAIVGCFNLQGASWDRVRRKFHIHSSRPLRLSTTVTPADVEPFRALAGSSSSGDSNGSAGNGVGADEQGAAGAAAQQRQQQQRFAVYHYGTEELRVCGPHEGVDVALAKAGSDLVWVAPLQSVATAAAGPDSSSNGSSSISFAPLGLIDMFNGGGAVLRCSLEAGSSTSTNASAGTSTSSGGGSSRGGPPAAVAALKLRGCGRFLAYASARPRSVLINLAPHDFTWDEFTRRLELVVPQHAEDLRCEVEVLF